MLQPIQTDKAPAAAGTYSQAIKAGQTVYLSGQLGLDPATNEFVGASVKEQIKQIFTNLQAVAKAAGGDLKHFVKLSIFLTDLKHFADVNAVMEEFFQKPYPARSTIAVSGLPKNAPVEVDAIMVLDSPTP